MLTGSGKVESTKFISKDDALKFYQDQNKNDPLLLEMVSADSLPSSLEVNAKDPAMLRDPGNFSERRRRSRAYRLSERCCRFACLLDQYCTDNRRSSWGFLRLTQF